MSKYEFIEKTIRSCENPLHFISVKQMIENYKEATKEEQIRLNQELRSTIKLRGFELEHLESLIENIYN